MSSRRNKVFKEKVLEKWTNRTKESLCPVNKLGQQEKSENGSLLSKDSQSQDIKVETLNELAPKPQKVYTVYPKPIDFASHNDTKSLDEQVTLTSKPPQTLKNRKRKLKKRLQKMKKAQTKPNSLSFTYKPSIT